MSIDRVYLGGGIRLPVSGRRHFTLLPAQELALQRAVRDRLPHRELVTLLVAAREAADRIAAWSCRWSDPVL